MEPSVQMIGLAGQALMNATLNETQPFRIGRSIEQNAYYEVHMNGWNAPADMQDHILDHWKSFPTQNPFIHYMLGVLYTVFFMVSCVGNGIVIWIFLGCKSLRTPSNMFIVSLACTDFIMMAKTPIFIVNSFGAGPVTSLYWCRVYGVLGAISGQGGGSTVALIAFDRYRTIARPFDGKLTKTQVMLMILVQFAILVPTAVAPGLEVWGRFVPEGFLTSCTADYITDEMKYRTFIYWCFTMYYCVPGLAIIYFYSRIYGHVKAHEKAMKEQAKKMNVKSLRSVGSAEEQEKSAEIRIAKVGISMWLLFIISWTPYIYVVFLGLTKSLDKLTPFVSMVPAVFCKAVACLDPFIYAANHPKYRLELQKKLPWFCIHEEAPKPNDATSTATSTEQTEKA